MEAVCQSRQILHGRNHAADHLVELLIVKWRLPFQVPLEDRLADRLPLLGSGTAQEGCIAFRRRRGFQWRKPAVRTALVRAGIGIAVLRRDPGQGFKFNCSTQA